MRGKNLKFAQCRHFCGRKQKTELPLKSELAKPDPTVAANAADKSADKSTVRWVLVSLSLSTLLSSLGTSIANVGLPTIAQVFAASFQEVQWVVLAYLLAITTVIVGVGRLGDIIGRRRLLLTGILLFTAASVLCGVAPALWLLVAARALQGLGAAIMLALTLALVGESVGKEKAGSAMGLLGSMSAIGTALGPSLGGLLIAGAGWRALFLLGVPLGLLAFFLVWRWLPADRKQGTGGGFDPLGTLLLGSSLAAYALAMTLGRNHFGPLNAALLLAAALGAGLFVFTETKVAAPLIRLALFRDPALGPGFAMSALVSSVVMATLVVGPFYLSGALGLKAVLVGLVLSTGPLVAAFCGVPAGRLTDRFGARRVVIAGLTGMAIGALLLALLPASLGVPGYVVPIAILTAGYALFQTANNTAVIADLPADRRGLVSGMLNLARYLGLITGASAMGAVFAFASTTPDMSHASAEALAAGMRFTFGVALLLVVSALLIALSSRPAPAVAVS
jgi:EmrB/QacA subfamily drug resistance transporter